ncbi:MAG TPA: hypothetical protein VHZ95_13515, partial [Polyangiales bacterium]|nr:hypothetical protein [Polyangiales bacterium]
MFGTLLVGGFGRGGGLTLARGSANGLAADGGGWIPAAAVSGGAGGGTPGLGNGGGAIDPLAGRGGAELSETR